jgi:hypothetical protein
MQFQAHQNQSRHKVIMCTGACSVIPSTPGPVPALGRYVYWRMYCNSKHTKASPSNKWLCALAHVIPSTPGPVPALGCYVYWSMYCNSKHTKASPSNKWLCALSHVILSFPGPAPAINGYVHFRL